MNSDKLIEKDLAHFWHPCSQMKDYETLRPVPVESAEGSYIKTKNGGYIIDASSSWWCKSLGHKHPGIRKAVNRQLDAYEHVITANTSTETLTELSAELASISKFHPRVFYADNGSTGVEIAMKICRQYFLQTGKARKKNFAALKNGYHGETIITLAAGDCELYSKPFKSMIPYIYKISNIPYRSGKNDPEWNSMNDSEWNIIEEKLDSMAENLCGIIFEPIVQGAGGLRPYSPEFLRKLRIWADKNDVQLIADEIMTGFGRTGKMLACEHAGIHADFYVLSKALTAGWAPMSAVLCREDVYQAFYDDYNTGKAFIHSNTYTGNAIAAAAALEAFKIYEEEDIFRKVEKRSYELEEAIKFVSNETGALSNIRSLGFIAAGDIVNPSNGKKFPSDARIGFKCFCEAVKRGAYLRPLTDIIYFLPPLNTKRETIQKLAEITVESLNAVIKKILF